MANYITAAQFTTFTGVTANEVEITTSATGARVSRVTEAQLQFEAELNKTFAGTEDDYALVQRAVAFLAAHLFRLRTTELVPSTAEGIGQSPSTYLREYKRIVNILKEGRREDDKPMFTGGFESVTEEDLGDDYQREGYIKK